MSVGGLCQVCAAATATDQCDRCGAVVCADHHDDDHGICVECAAELGVERDRGRDRDDGHPDVDRYQF